MRAPTRRGQRLWSALASPVTVAVLCGLGVLLLFATGALARPGGGQGYSGGGGGGGGGSSGGGGGEGAIIELLIRLIIEIPEVGIPLTVVVVSGWIVYRRYYASAEEWDSTDNSSDAASDGSFNWPKMKQQTEPETIRQLDPEFSIVLFEDFAFRLYAAAHGARGAAGAMKQLAPYLSEGSRAALSHRAPMGVPVSNVVVGALRCTNVTIPEGNRPPGTAPGSVQIWLQFEANLTAGLAGSEQTYYTLERWRFERELSVQSRPPEATKSFHCPNCAAPFESTDDQTCSYCGEVVDGGRFDWTVTSIELRASETRPPALTSTVVERGNDKATVLHPQLKDRWASLQKDDPEATDEAIFARLSLIYEQLNAAWTDLKLPEARPFVTDGLYDYLRYWIGAYERQDLRNVLTEMRILRWEKTKLVRDAHYDALTIRFWATGLDYTVRTGTDEAVSGDKGKERRYSEYWTLVRGQAARGKPGIDKSCPNCAAPLDISQSGHCDHCQAHITSGEFDWVLSKIEQDDSYGG